MAEQRMIDWSFFSMARYLLTADSAARQHATRPHPRVTPAQRRRLDERLRQVIRLQRS